MKTFFIDGTVNKDMSALFRDCLENPGDIQIFFESSGGSIRQASEIIHMLNQNADRVTLIANHEISSSAWMIFFYSKCKRDVVEGTLGMIHLGRISVQTPYNKVLYFNDKFQLNSMKDSAKILYKQMKLIGCSKKQIKRVKDGYDVWYTSKELKKMLRKHEKALQC